jgi:ABC-2 type transport system ATP-binding protein
VLRLTQLRKAFGGLVAVDDVSIDLRPGEVFGLLGPNGAGKSTTIGMAVGLIRPDSGQAHFEGHGPTSDPAVRARIGVAPQALALYDELSGAENLHFFGSVFGLRGERLRARVDAVLEMVGLTPRRRDRLGAYSGGMKRRLNLAAAMIHDPPLLLLDEPTAGVDPQSRNNILDLVVELKGQGRTIVYTTHYMEEAQRLCDRVAIMDKGKVLAEGPVEALINAHGGESIVTIESLAGETRVTTADPVGELARRLASPDSAANGGSGGAITGVRVDRPNLEAVFLHLTGRRLRD